MEPHIPEELHAALLPVLDSVAHLTREIKGMEEWIENLAENEYAETQLLQQVSGVGTITALSYGSHAE